LGVFSFISVESPHFQKRINENTHHAEGGEAFE